MIHQVTHTVFKIDDGLSITVVHDAGADLG